jgi:hypothetical protein
MQRKQVYDHDLRTDLLIGVRMNSQENQMQMELFLFYKVRWPG